MPIGPCQRRSRTNGAKDSGGSEEVERRVIIDLWGRERLGAVFICVLMDKTMSD